MNRESATSLNGDKNWEDPKFIAEQNKLIAEANEKRRKNIYDALFVLCVLGLLSLILYALHAIRLPEGLTWNTSQSDGFLLLVSLIAIVGAIWAVLARIDAERAFLQAKFATEKSQEAAYHSNLAYHQSIQTYKSFADAFEFDDILEEGKLPYYIDKIGEPDSEVTLFLGFPCVGFFYDDNKFKDHSLATFKKLIAKMESMTRQHASTECNFKFNIAAFKRHLAEEYIDKMLLEKRLGNDYADKLRDELDHFYQAWTNMRAKFTSVEICPLQNDLGMRFAVYSKSTRKKSSFDHNDEINSMVWVVADFTKEAAEKFKSAGFRTEDINFSKTLHALFRNNHANIKALQTQ